MEPKTAIDKLQILLPHWIEHNQNHAAEFQKWAASSRAEGAERLAGLLDTAAAHMVATDEILKKAAAEVGSPPSDGHSHAHHH